MSDTDQQKREQRQEDQNGMQKDPKTGEVMCWKDKTKICKCDRPKWGIFCGHFPLPTD